MPFTVREFEDLITLINQQPEWRGRLLKALFPDLNIAKAMQDLAENAIALRQMLEQMNARLINVEQDVGVLKQDVGVLKQDVSTLKGDSLERKYRDTAAGIFGLYIRNGRDLTNQIADQLYAAMETQIISEAELTQVLAADLLWGGEERKTKEPIILVMEASWLAEASDVVRAVARSAILRRIGLNALAVVGGKEWTDEARNLAKQSQAVTTTGGRVDRLSWELAMQA